MIDIWMLFTMTVPFLEVVLQTFTEVMKRRSRSPMEAIAQRGCGTWVTTAGSLTLPIASLVFSIVFWTVGLIVSHSPTSQQDPNMVDCHTIETA